MSWDNKNCWRQMVTFPARVLHHALVLRMRVFLKGLRLSLIIGQARGRKQDGNTATALGWDGPKDFCPIAPAQAPASPPTGTTSLALPGLNTVLLVGDLRPVTLASVDYTLLIGNWGKSQHIYKINEILKLYEMLDLFSYSRRTMKITKTTSRHPSHVLKR